MDYATGECEHLEMRILLEHRKEKLRLLRQTMADKGVANVSRCSTVRQKLMLMRKDM